jgi:hypothetical protein
VDDGLSRAPIEETLLDFIYWLVSFPHVWPDDRMKLHKMLDHFEGVQSPSAGDPGRYGPRVVVTERHDHRKIKYSFGRKFRDALVMKAQKGGRRARILGVGHNLRNRPSSKEVVGYGRKVLLMIDGLDEEGLLPPAMREHVVAFREEVDAAEVCLRLGGSVS